MNIGILILAAGKGKRMKSNLIPKAMNTLFNKPLIEHIIRNIKGLSKEKSFIVINKNSKSIKTYFKEKLIYIYQEKAIGTGDAVRIALKKIKKFDNILILCADIPLIKKKTLKRFLKEHFKNKRDCTVLTGLMEENDGYGRI